MLAQLGRTAAPVPLADAVALSGFLDLVPDPRGVRGRRYRLSALVTAAAASVLAGARSLTAITEWIGDIPTWACRVLGFPVDPLSGTVSVPHPHTLRRLLVQLDGDALDRAIGAFLSARATPAGPTARLGQPLRARIGEQDISSALSSSHDKQRALLTLDVVTGYVATKEIETAFTLAQRALQEGLRLRSGKITERARALRRAYSSPRPPSIVREFDDQLHTTYL